MGKNPLFLFSQSLLNMFGKTVDNLYAAIHIAGNPIISWSLY